MRRTFPVFLLGLSVGLVAPAVLFHRLVYTPGGPGFIRSWVIGVLVAAVIVDLGCYLAIRRTRQARDGEWFWEFDRYSGRYVIRPRRARGSPHLRLLFAVIMVAATAVGLGTVAKVMMLSPSFMSTAAGEAKPTPAGTDKAKDPPPGDKGKGDAKTSGGGPAAAGDSPAAAEAEAVDPGGIPLGQKLMGEHCLNCHRYSGRGFGATDDLNEAGKTHTSSWFIQMMRDPVNVGLKRMPKPRLTDDEILLIAAFLSGRGGPKGQEKEWFGRKDITLSENEIIHAGEQTYQRLNCESCHRIGDEGGDLGPDLTTEGQKRSVEWLEAFFVDYFIQKGAGMPFLAISQDEINALAAYLGSLE